MSSMNRLRWKCRRGMLELDLLFERFLSHHYATLSIQERETFDRLLTRNDAELWAWASGETPCDKGEFAPLVAVLRRC